MSADLAYECHTCGETFWLTEGTEEELSAVDDHRASNPTHDIRLETKWKAEE